MDLPGIDLATLTKARGMLKRKWHLQVVHVDDLLDNAVCILSAVSNQLTVSLIIYKMLQTWLSYKPLPGGPAALTCTFNQQKLVETLQRRWWISGVDQPTSIILPQSFVQLSSGRPFKAAGVTDFLAWLGDLMDRLQGQGHDNYSSLPLVRMLWPQWSFVLEPDCSSV